MLQVRNFSLNVRKKNAFIFHCRYFSYLRRKNVMFDFLHCCQLSHFSPNIRKKSFRFYSWYFSYLQKSSDSYIVATFSIFHQMSRKNIFVFYSQYFLYLRRNKNNVRLLHYCQLSKFSSNVRKKMLSHFSPGIFCIYVKKM